MARELFEQFDPGQGLVRALWLSIFVGVAVALAGWVYLEEPFMALMFGSLALSSYLTLQQMSGGGFGGRPW